MDFGRIWVSCASFALEGAWAVSGEWILSHSEAVAPVPHSSLLHFCRDQICFANALKLPAKGEAGAEGESPVPAECPKCHHGVTALNFTRVFQS